MARTSKTHITGNIDLRVGIEPPDIGEYLVLGEDYTLDSAYWDGERFHNLPFISVMAWARFEDPIGFSPSDEKKLIQMNETYGDFDSTEVE